MIAGSGDTLFPRVRFDDTVAGWKLFVDGASKNNPGPSGAGIYLLRDGKEVLRTGFYLGHKTNNEAEYLALLIGLCLLEQYYKSGDSVRVISDSQLLVRQLRGEYRVRKAELQPLCALGRHFLIRYKADIAHVLRTDNVVADLMANRGVDKKEPVPEAMVRFFQKHGVQL